MRTGSEWVGEDLVREALWELADEDVQRQVWFSPDTPNDYIEAVCELFDDSNLGDRLDKGPVFGAEVDETLRRLSSIAAQIDGYRSPEDVISDPLMPELRRLAGEALRGLDEALPK
ncbi:MAG: hypothetical protein WB565_09170 [Acidimicrobiales bacterium]